MKKLLIVLLIATSFLGFCQEIKKQNISVLYVGYNSEKPMPEDLDSPRVTGGMTPERFKVEYGKRMSAFKNLLQTYFTKVTLVDSRDYKEGMSSQHDVTIFDETPTLIKEQVIHNDPETGKFVSIEQAEYVSDDFNSAAIFIGHTASTIGASLGSKLDWYCLCLDRHAHHIKVEHAIFKGPFKTTITLKDRKTPDNLLLAFDGGNVSKEIPMWEVDKEGYLDGKGIRVGMVARGWGFEDSPNSEIISSGVCTKEKTAVALGRHGKFFLWGFAGSPDYMTEEAKKVFANVVVYTNKHKENKLIARKYNDRIATKQYIDRMLFNTTKRAYLNYIEYYKKMNEEIMKIKAIAKKKQEAGEKLSRDQEMVLNSKPLVVKTREQFLENSIGKNSWSKITGLDTLAIRKYLKENRDYFYSEPAGFYDLKVDEDIKSLGIANTNIKVLDKAISILEKGAEKDKASRILLRYTLENFKTANDWRVWFNKNKDNMFFTETGGYVWMVNDASANSKTRPRSEKEIAQIRSK
ncbi:hypothetical protein [uncultured Croceitalea sp.]|uniref:hypothetical protein n=1 Tax=uncultured Croceitalea sp. TaxID=1798908 RepID=UPI00374E4215